MTSPRILALSSLFLVAACGGSSDVDGGPPDLGTALDSGMTDGHMCVSFGRPCMVDSDCCNPLCLPGLGATGICADGSDGGHLVDAGSTDAATSDAGSDDAAVSDASASDAGPVGPAALCRSTGGTVGTNLCCTSVSDFADMCGGIGACGCSPTYSHDVQVCDCPSGMCFSPTTGCH